MLDINSSKFNGNVSDLSSEVNFIDKVAIITGAGCGLGKSYALELSKRGAKVVVNDLGCSSDGSNANHFDNAGKVVHEIKSHGGQAIANYDNVAHVEGGNSVVNSALNHFGTVDILINNAGILRDTSFPKMEEDDWKSVLDVHLNGAYNATYPAFKIMKNKGYGRIVMTTSASGLYGSFGQVNYAAAKMALIGMMNSLKLEGGKYNINVNAVAPISASRLTKGIIPDNVFDKANPELVSSLVLYLCSALCLCSGEIYNAGIGYASRAAVFTNSWTKIAESNSSACSPEEVHKKWSIINDMSDLKSFKNTTEMFLDFLPLIEE